MIQNIQKNSNSSLVVSLQGSETPTNTIVHCCGSSSSTFLRRRSKQLFKKYVEKVRPISTLPVWILNIFGILSQRSVRRVVTAPVEIRVYKIDFYTLTLFDTFQIRQSGETIWCNWFRSYNGSTWYMMNLGVFVKPQMKCDEIWFMFSFVPLNIQFIFCSQFLSISPEIFIVSKKLVLCYLF